MDLQKRKNIRLPNYDYSQAGGYFITICIENRRCLLSVIRSSGECGRAEVKLTALGVLAEETLKQLSMQYGVAVDAYVIMPNHIHLVLLIEADRGKKRISVGRFMGAFKSIVANQWCKECERQGALMGKLLQRNYYEHMLRNDRDYQEKYRYIDENPDKWLMDELYMPQ